MHITPRLSVEGPLGDGGYEIGVKVCDTFALHVITRAEADALIAALQPVGCAFGSFAGAAACLTHLDFVSHKSDGWWCEGGRVTIPFGSAFGSRHAPSTGTEQEQRMGTYLRVGADTYDMSRQRIVAAKGQIAAALTLLVAHEQLHPLLIAAQHLLGEVITQLDDNQREGTKQGGT